MNADQPDPLPVHEREVRAYAAESGDVVLRRHLTAVMAEYDAMRAENAALRSWMDAQKRQSASLVAQFDSGEASPWEVVEALRDEC